MISVGRNYLEQKILKMYMTQIESYCKALLKAVMIWVLNFLSYSRSQVLPTGLSVTRNSKVISEDDIKMDAHPTTVHALVDE